MKHLKSEFAARYVTASDDPKKREDTIRKQVVAALKNAIEKGRCASGAWGGEEWVWCLT